MKTIIALLFCASLLHSHAADINVAELRDKMPLGQLGKPLGSRIVLTGKSPERAVLLTNPLEVSEVDGKHQVSPVAIEIRGEIKIQEGVTYQLEGYEAGEFSDPPEWLTTRMQTRFQYRSFFVVTKVIAPAPKLNHAARFQFRLVTDEKDANAEALNRKGGKGKVWMSREVLLDETSVSSAKVVEGSVWVTFNDEGVKKFVPLIFAKDGRQLAIVFDHELIAEPTINAGMNDFSKDCRMLITGSFTVDEAEALAKAITTAIQAAAVNNSPPTNQDQRAEMNKPDAQLWPPPLDEKRLIGTWVRKNAPIQGVENHTLLVLREDHSWYEAEISGPLTEPVRFKKFAPDSKWEVVNVGEKNTQAMLLFKHKEGGSNVWNILKVGAEELDTSGFGPSIIDLRHYTRCDAQTAAKLNERLNQKETEPTAK